MTDDERPAWFDQPHPFDASYSRPTRFPVCVCGRTKHHQIHLIPDSRKAA